MGSAFQLNPTRMTGWFSLPLLTALLLLPGAIATAQEASEPDSFDRIQAPAGSNNSTPSAANSEPEIEDPNNLRPLAQDNTLLSVEAGERLMSEAGDAVAQQDYTLAIQKLQQSREIFNQLSNFHQQLASSFNGIDNRISSAQRTKALETAQMRDRATFQLALVHRAQNQPELAVPLLIQIIQSQQPTRDLGQQAYQQLLELGFVDSPYPQQPTSSN